MRQQFLFIMAFFVVGFTLNAQLIPNVLVDNAANDGECTIVIDPQSPSHILAASNPDVIYRSADAGLTWIKSNLSLFASNTIIGDVALAADNNGFFYYQALDLNYLFKTMRSGDYGQTWNTETVFGDTGWTEDKNWLATDNVTTSPYYGRLYCSWTRRSNGALDPGYVFMDHSNDSGSSWSNRDTLTIENSTVPPIGTGIATGPFGEVNVTWGGGSPNQIQFNKSIDGASTWFANPVIIDSNVQPSTDYYTYIQHSIGYSAQFTSLACDVSSSPYKGNLYCVWEDLRNGTDNADIFLARSANGGQNWTTQRVNDDMTTRNQVVPTVAVDPTTGWIYVSYLDARLNTDNFDDTLHYYLAWSSDGGQTFQNVQVSQQPSLVTYIHTDYMGLSAYGGKAQLLWAGINATSGLQMWTACATYGVDTSFTMLLTLLLISIHEKLNQIFPHLASLL